MKLNKKKKCMNVCVSWLARKVNAKEKLLSASLSRNKMKKKKTKTKNVEPCTERQLRWEKITNFIQFKNTKFVNSNISNKNIKKKKIRKKNTMNEKNSNKINNNTRCEVWVRNVRVPFRPL